ncbi:tRNA (adenosine(37)-N6)-threonylcarbamoyltransferase complex dimerization subunit type 1 TsaB [Psychromonas ossibalaenae]|uniref:tRNA (adenosine(37)-N6)-threonylcarbamoyltransferase complex dimerization subunit type 1 TsaB n=1 Tax=Psychromonas ossibalaenae TaxID=444922 RepID=UPI00037ABB9F|nr:tRNA (adenosine(37)-N6)-threonylcarbamoyltransferase complex dimerization subunit type 1 TsaB [Psychromonas ossibalaenae]
MSNKLNVLCVDTSTEACSVAVLCQSEEKQQVISDHFMLAPREHTKKILPTVEQVLQQAGLTLPEIDILAYGRGPGSFTGVRIGISIAQGLAFGIEKKMVGVSTLQAMAQQAFKTQQAADVYAAIDARMGEVYFAHYQLKDELMVLVNEEVVVKPVDLLALELDVAADSVLVGSGWGAYPELAEYFKNALKLDIEFPSAKYMLDEVVSCVEKSLAVLPELAAPVYLRDKVTWKKLPGRE